MEIKKIGVIGAGMMGSEIALAFAMSGYKVSLKDETLELASKGKDKIAKALDKLVKKGTLGTISGRTFLFPRLGDEAC